MVRKVRALLDGADPSQVAAGMRRSATLRRIERRAPVDDCAAYMLKLAPYLRYGAALREGLPIATGVIEGACRHLIRRRLDIGGARWGTEGAEAVLLLRAVILSGDYDAYWEFHRHAMFGRVHASRYRGDVPNTNPSRPGLRCVKLAGFASVVKELLPSYFSTSYEPEKQELLRVSVNVAVRPRHAEHPSLRPNGPPGPGSAPCGPETKSYLLPPLPPLPAAPQGLADPHAQPGRPSPSKSQ